MKSKRFCPPKIKNVRAKRIRAEENDTKIELEKMLQKHGTSLQDVEIIFKDGSGGLRKMFIDAEVSTNKEEKTNIVSDYIFVDLMSLEDENYFHRCMKKLKEKMKESLKNVEDIKLIWNISVSLQGIEKTNLEDFDSRMMWKDNA